MSFHFLPEAKIHEKVEGHSEKEKNEGTAF
jgi:hypothetical protein